MTVRQQHSQENLEAGHRENSQTLSQILPNWLQGGRSCFPAYLGPEDDCPTGLFARLTHSSTQAFVLFLRQELS
jgi:hypothetical protein